VTSRLQYYAYQQDGPWTEDVGVAGALEWFSGEAGGSASGTSTAAAEKAVRDLLYGVENLRKRPGSED
jgi:tRNA (guanine-N(7)-)-methyltransferase subunit TRM82